MRRGAALLCLALAACGAPPLQPDPPTVLTVGETTVTVGGRVEMTVGGRLN